MYCIMNAISMSQLLLDPELVFSKDIIEQRKEFHPIQQTLNDARLDMKQMMTMLSELWLKTTPASPRGICSNFEN